MLRLRRAFFVSILCGFAALSVSPSLAQSWPTRPVRFIIPLGPGSGVDITARLSQGADLRTAVRDGKAVVTAAIAGAVTAPDGRRMANPRPTGAPPCGVAPPRGAP